MSRNRWPKYVIYVLLLLALAVSLMAPKVPQIVENIYSQNLYLWLIRPYSLLTGLFPFSLAEVTIVSTALYLVYVLVRAGIMLRESSRTVFNAIPRVILKLALVILIVYTTFNLMWGMNYSRVSFAEIHGIVVEPSSVEDLTRLALSLTYRANDLRLLVNEDSNGVMALSRSTRTTLAIAHLGYDRAAETYPVLGGSFGKPKGVFLSPYWSYTGIGGMYFPFTAEANVNTNSPDFLIPFAATHEMAHQRGFAREDEANYIGYLTGVLHPDYDFQYSGLALALMNTMNALWRYDAEAWAEVRSQYSEGLDRDFRAYREYLARYDGRLQEISNDINDSYLRANRQEDGVQSYGRMVDLLMAEFKAGEHLDNQGR